MRLHRVTTYTSFLALDALTFKFKSSSICWILFSILKCYVLNYNMVSLYSCFLCAFLSSLIPILCSFPFVVCVNHSWNRALLFWHLQLLQLEQLRDSVRRHSATRVQTWWRCTLFRRHLAAAVIQASMYSNIAMYSRCQWNSEKSLGTVQKVVAGPQSCTVLCSILVLYTTALHAQLQLC